MGRYFIRLGILIVVLPLGAAAAAFGVAVCAASWVASPIIALFPGVVKYNGRKI